MANVSDLKYITVATLREWLKKGKSASNDKFAIVDVRDSDYAGGHIKGCLHFPSGNFYNSLPELKDTLLKRNARDVVIHCAMSQSRAPKAALTFMNETAGLEHPFRVWVLKGGFTKWVMEYGEDSEVTEDYDRRFWDDDY